MTIAVTFKNLHFNYKYIQYYIIYSIISLKKKILNVQFSGKTFLFFMRNIPHILNFMDIHICTKRVESLI